LFQIEPDAGSRRLNGVSTLLDPGTIIDDRYEILSLVGSGGMGRVYRARHLGLDKLVALKVLTVDRFCTHDADARFSREARALARLDHPGCVRVLDHGRTGGLAYIALDLVEGITLGTAIKSDRFPMERAVDIARKLLVALSHAHALGVIHRDIKPDNIVLRDHRWPVLIDLGLASLADEAAFTARGMCIGSPSYLAPERLLGKPHDTRTDLYAIGVILYEMVSGTKPFVGDNPQHTMTLALSRPPRPLRAVRRDISPALDRIITRALAKDPARRFADADEMLLALNDVEHAAERAVAARESDTAATHAFGKLAITEPSWLARAWGWLRYGGWRWRRDRNDEGPELTPGPFESLGSSR
jgi:serine/threonine-protein kinase